MNQSIQDAIQGLSFQYENCTRETLPDLLRFYAPNATFKDPFQEVVGHAKIEEIFTKMFDQLNNPKFVIVQTLMGDQQASLLWEFQFSMKRWNTKPQKFLGVSWLYFDANHQIKKHIDYWDPASGIYEQLPLLGPVLRFIKKKA